MAEIVSVMARKRSTTSEITSPLQMDLIWYVLIIVTIALQFDSFVVKVSLHSNLKNNIPACASLFCQSISP